MVYLYSDGKSTGEDTPMADTKHNDAPSSTSTTTTRFGDDVRPVPDPTVLTTQQLLRELNSLREILESRLDGMDRAVDVLQSTVNRSPTLSEINVRQEEKFNNFDQRFKDRDKAIDLLQVHIDGFNQYVEDSVGRLKDLHQEKFRSIETQFTERDTRTEQTSRDSKVAVDAALQAAKEAVGEQNKSSALAIAKSEAATTKQIDSINTLIQSGNQALNDKIDDMKERITAFEGRSKGIGDGWGYMVGAFGLLLTLVSIVSVIVVVFKPH
jgi:hypothetical protein